MKATKTLSGLQTGYGLRGFAGTRVKRMMGLKMHGASISSEESLTFFSLFNKFGATPGAKPGISEPKKIVRKSHEGLGASRRQGFVAFYLAPCELDRKGSFHPQGK